MKQLFLAICLTFLALPLLNAQDLKVFSENGKSGFKDEVGKIIIPAKYDFVLAFMKEGFAYVTKNDKSGYIDKTGKEIVPVVYESVGFLADLNLFRVEKNEKYGFIDTKGKIVTVPKYDEVEYCIKGFYKVKLNDKIGIIGQGVRKPFR
ncbi:MAG: WG repeat-containing protein [Chitinophagaceae bacterium]|nr:WG repeat-containing protein [Chitinophagaceae bacterium]